MSTVAIKEQRMIEVYSNDDGQIVIKDCWTYGEDNYCMFWPEHADAIIAAILKEKADLDRGAPIEATLS
jgi:hypothetical protein